MKTALQKIEDQALQEIKDYSTGKRYFVSKFQDDVRKRNIKAKKKLIGTGNAGALSGAGPLEEVELDEGILKLVGLDTDKTTLQEKIRKLVAQVLKEAYTTNTRKRS